MSWRPRAAPLAPRAVYAAGEVAVRLGRRLHDDTALAAMTAVAGPRELVVLAEEQALPWVDGVVYLGRDRGAPELLVPTSVEPDVPIDVLAAALRRDGRARPPLAVLAEPPRVLSLAGARAVDRGALARWLDGAREVKR